MFFSEHSVHAFNGVVTRHCVVTEHIHKYIILTELADYA